MRYQLFSSASRSDSHVPFFLQRTNKETHNNNNNNNNKKLFMASLVMRVLGFQCIVDIAVRWEGKKEISSNMRYGYIYTYRYIYISIYIYICISVCMQTNRTEWRNGAVKRRKETHHVSSRTHRHIRELPFYMKLVCVCAHGGSVMPLSSPPHSLSRRVSLPAPQNSVLGNLSSENLHTDSDTSGG